MNMDSALGGGKLEMVQPWPKLWWTRGGGPIEFGMKVGLLTP